MFFAKGNSIRSFNVLKGHFKGSQRLRYSETAGTGFYINPKHIAR